MFDCDHVFQLQLLMIIYKIYYNVVITYLGFLQLNYFLSLAGCLPTALDSLLVRCLLYFLGKESKNQCSCTCLPSQSNFNWTHHGESYFLFSFCERNIFLFYQHGIGVLVTGATHTIFVFHPVSHSQDSKQL